jgi:hypothetical protein
MKGIKHEDKNARSNTSTMHSPKNIKANGFLQAKVQDSPKKFVFCNILFERVLEDKKIRNE